MARSMGRRTTPACWSMYAAGRFRSASCAPRISAKASLVPLRSAVSSSASVRTKAVTASPVAKRPKASTAARVPKTPLSTLSGSVAIHCSLDVLERQRLLQPWVFDRHQIDALRLEQDHSGEQTAHGEQGR